MKPNWKNWCARMLNPGSASWSTEVSDRSQLLEELLRLPKIRDKALKSTHIRSRLAGGFGIDESDYYGRLLLAYVRLFFGLKLEPHKLKLVELSSDERQYAQDMYLIRSGKHVLSTNSGAVPSVSRDRDSGE
jgi:hypothetical protein